MTSIGDSAFSHCICLTSITIPASVNNIENYAFASCSNLISVHFTGNAPVMGKSVFKDTAKEFTVYYLDGKTGFTSPNWQGYKAVSDGGSK